MSNEIPLNILLKLIDEASPEFRKLNAEQVKAVESMKEAQVDANKTVQESSEKTGKKVEESTKKQKTSIDTLKKSVADFRSKLSALAFVIGIVSIGINEWANVNRETRMTLDEVGLAIKNIILRIGQLITAVSPLYNILKLAAKPINDLFGHKSLNDIERAKNALKDFSKQQSELSTLFVAGKMPAEQFYQSVLSLQNSVISQNKRIEGSMIQLANLQAELTNKNNLMLQSRIDDQTKMLNIYKENFQTAHKDMKLEVMELGVALRNNLSSAFADMAVGAKDATQAMKDVGKAMIRMLVEVIAQRAIAWVLERTLFRATIADSLASASLMLAAWSPVALAVTLATAGANAVGASVGILSTTVALGASMGALQGIAIGQQALQGKFHKGGMIKAHNGLAVDEIPIIAQTGEGVLSRRGMANLGGERVLNALNKGNTSSTNNKINITINYPKMSNREEATKLARMIGFEIEKQLQYAR